MKTTENDSTPEMSTLSDCITKAVKEGYAENFKISSKGLTTEIEDIFYQPEQVAISNFYRFEGYSDPQDNAILYVIQTEDGKKGLIIDAYGAYSNEKISQFIRQVEDIQKKAPVGKRWWQTILKAS